MNEILFEVEYEECPIRHAYVTCPSCGKKFDAGDIVYELPNGRLNDRYHHISSDHELVHSSYKCPCCEVIFACDLGFATYGRNAGFNCEPTLYKHKSNEVGYPECAKGALKRKEVWE